MRAACATSPLGTESSAGHDLLTQLQHDLAKLTPPLRRVAQHCIAYSYCLHLMGIQEVATASQTIPAAVVRLAQRYGLKGYRELKLAFLPTLSLNKAQVSQQTLSNSEPQNTAVALIDKMAADIAQIRIEIMRTEFARTVQAIHSADRILMPQTAKEGDAAFHLPLHKLLRQRLGSQRVLNHGLREAPALPGDLWILLPSEHATACRGNWAYRHVASQPNALHFIEITHNGYTVDSELIASFRSMNTRQDAFKTNAFCDALGSAVAHGAVSQGGPRAN